MTDDARKLLGRHKKTTPDKKRRKTGLFLLALVLIIGSGVFLFLKEKLTAFSDELARSDNNKPGYQKVLTNPVIPRGNIYDRNYRPLAATYETYAIYARPLEIEDPASVADLLQNLLGFEQADLLASLKSERGFVWIAKGIDQEQAHTITDRNIKGLYKIVETKRIYPNNVTAAHAVGFVEDDQGLDGIEFQYNSLLRGDEISRTELDALHFGSTVDLGRNPAHIVLNLDLMIQAKIENYLIKRVKITGATSGLALIIDAHSGAVRGMASFPAFNPNRYWEFSSSALDNKVISEPVYPGELGLIFQQAAAINYRNEKKSRSPENSENVQPPIILEPEILKRRKLATAPKIDSVAPQYFSSFIQHLGFNHQPATDLSLAKEAPTAASLLSDPSYHTSALRLLTGFTTLVNNGRIVTPRLLHKIYPKGSVEPIEPGLTAPEAAEFLHADTSRELLDFLADKWLKLGKSGPASLKPLLFETHRFSSLNSNVKQADLYTTDQRSSRNPPLQQSILLGAVPAKDPKLTMLVVLTYPENYADIYPEALETLGGKFSILKPDTEMIQKILYLAEQTAPVPSPDFWETGAEVLSVNSNGESNSFTEPAGINPGQQILMPDVTGKSLRAGLQVLQRFNLHIRLVGSGEIIQQIPAAGAEIGSQRECTLTLQQKI